MNQPKIPQTTERKSAKGTKWPVRRALSYAEIADRAGVSKRAVCSALTKGLFPADESDANRLRKVLAKAGIQC